MQDKFVIKYLGILKQFLGIEVIRIDHETVGLHQSTLIMQLLFVHEMGQVLAMTSRMSLSDSAPEEATLLHNK